MSQKPTDGPMNMARGGMRSVGENETQSIDYLGSTNLENYSRNQGKAKNATVCQVTKGKTCCAAAGAGALCHCHAKNCKPDVQNCCRCARRRSYLPAGQLIQR